MYIYRHKDNFYVVLNNIDFLFCDNKVFLIEDICKVTEKHTLCRLDA